MKVNLYLGQKTSKHDLNAPQSSGRRLQLQSHRSTAFDLDTQARGAK